jgi:GT2 family glycosyltransferase
MKNYSGKSLKGRVFFVILHYKNLDITIRSVEALLQLDHIDKCGIVIVDNASRDGTGARLKRMFDGCANIWVLLNEHDGGFSAGNNIGYAYARKMGADCVVCMNSDIIITQKNFVELLWSCCTDSHVIGPDIVTLDGVHQNPLRNERMSTRRMGYIIVYNFVISLIYANKCTGRLYLKLRERTKKLKNAGSRTRELHSGDCVLHGACVIFMPKWTKEESFAFVPGIYMYGEEDLLAEYMHSKGYHMSLQPELKVNHLDGSSTKMEYSTEVDRRRFKSRNMFRSFVYIYCFRWGKKVIK